MMVGCIVFAICVSMGLSLVLTISAIMNFRTQQDAPSSDQAGWYVEMWNVHNGSQVIFRFEQSVVVGRSSLHRHTIGAIAGDTDHTVSREQCLLYEYSNQLALWNLASVNPTAVNGVRVTQPVPLAVGDRLQMGNSLYILTRAERL